MAVTEQTLFVQHLCSCFMVVMQQVSDLRMSDWSAKLFAELCRMIEMFSGRDGDSGTRYDRLFDNHLLTVLTDNCR